METLKQQILQVRDTGETNMFDTYQVQRIADRLNLYDLVIFIQKHRKEYSLFILTGDESLLEAN